ncbi:MAG: type pilus assembly protein PilW [Rhodocyclales bacterium]|nr:type pilus assembly protein PilW [Rhodocyclales bacterium]
MQFSKFSFSGTNKSRGFTLVELLISMTIGIVIVGAVGYVYLSSKRTFQAEDGLSRIQENARMAFDTLTYDLRQPGSTGCFTVSGNTTQNLTAGTWYGVEAFSGDAAAGAASQAVTGYKDASTTTTTTPITNPPGNSTVVGGATTGDAIRIIRADFDTEYRLNAPIAALATTVTLVNAGNLVANDLIVISDCSTGYTLTTKISGVAASTLTLTTAVPTGFSFNQSATKVYRLRASLYYLGATTTGDTATTSLWRQYIGVGGVTSSEELVGDVNNMVIKYGVDSTGDNSVDSYEDASVVAADAALGAAAADRWQKVLSIRITLTLVSRSGSAIATNANTTGTTSAGQLLKTVTSTIAVRNRV